MALPSLPVTALGVTFDEFTVGFTLDTYTHAVQGMDEEAALKIGTALEGAIRKAQDAKLRTPSAESGYQMDTIWTKTPLFSAPNGAETEGFCWSLRRRRRPESNRCSGFCRPVPKPLGHVASRGARSWSG